MSDCLSYHEKISLLYKTLSYVDFKEQSSKINAMVSDSTYRINDQDETICERNEMYQQNGMDSQTTPQKEGKKMLQQKEMGSPKTVQSEVNSRSNWQENTYADEFHKLSADINRLMQEAKQQYMEVNASCETDKSSNHQDDFKGLYSRDDRTGVWSLTQRGLTNNYRGCHAIPGFSNNASCDGSTQLPVTSGVTAPSDMAMPQKRSILDRLVVLNDELHSEVGINERRPSASDSGGGFNEFGIGALCDGLDYSKDYSKDNIANDKALQKKESHNKVERRRRAIINDRINEIKSLLPDDINRDSCQKKSSVLQEAINYITTLQSYNDRLKHQEQKVRDTEENNNSLKVRIERLESCFKTNYYNNERAGLQSSTLVNDDDFALASEIKEDESDRDRAETPSPMPRNVFTVDETYANRYTAVSVPNVSLKKHCDMETDDLQFHF